MQKLFTLVSFIFFFLSAMAQSPQSFSYQAVVRNAAGNIVASQLVSFRISILQNSASGTSVYSETHSATTNQFGLVNLGIGAGSVLSGSFSAINWATGPYFIKIELDINGGSNYQLMGTQQLMSVPYALQANTVVEDNINFPFSKNSIIQIVKKISTPYTVPSGKILVVQSVATTGYACTSCSRQFVIDTNHFEVADIIPMFSYLPSGTVVSSSDTSLYMYGCIVDAVNITAIFKDISKLSYTVPAGKTLYLTFYERGVSYDFYIDNVFYPLWGWGKEQIAIPLIFTSGQTIRGTGKFSGYLR